MDVGKNTFKKIHGKMNKEMQKKRDRDLWMKIIKSEKKKDQGKGVEEESKLQKWGSNRE